MKNLKPIGTLYQTNDGEVVYIPISGKIGKIVKQPTPEEVLISKEKKTDHSLLGILKKHDKMS